MRMKTVSGRFAGVAFACGLYGTSSVFRRTHDLTYLVVGFVATVALVVFGYWLGSKLFPAG
jgi:hypothetical protein